jgi:hypothetical protein
MARCSSPRHLRAMVGDDAGHRRDHVVGSRREAADERQYCQREQLFLRHCEFYSVLQAVSSAARVGEHNAVVWNRV